MEFNNRAQKIWTKGSRHTKLKAAPILYKCIIKIVSNGMQISKVDNNFHDYCLPFKHNLLYITLNTNA